MKEFIPGETKIHYTECIWGQEELDAIVESLKTNWWAVGKDARLFEEKIAEYIGVKYGLFLNSGSSANLLAIESLGLKKGTEVITPACTFPTVVAPIIQNNLKPILVDVHLSTMNIDPDLIGSASTEHTSGLMIPHLLGNPADMDEILYYSEKYDLRVVEDVCDGLGSVYGENKLGSIGDIGTISFYPAHHIATIGEGGMLVTSNKEYYLKAKSLREWGRSCVCPVCTIAEDPNAFCPIQGLEIKGLPEDYDKRYTYLNIGYNLKPLEIQAAFGLIQLKRLPEFHKRRKYITNRLFEELQQYEEYLILPKFYDRSNPCLHAYPLTVKENAPFTRKDIRDYLHKYKIDTRLIFTGNIKRHPAYKDLKNVGRLDNSDYIMRNSFFIGVGPHITDEMLDYEFECFNKFFRRY